MKQHYLKLILFALLFTSQAAQAQSFLHTDGQDIVNEEGEPVILRGMGLGGWMLQEGYMLQTASFASPQHEIRKKIEELIGEDDTNEFYDAWLTNHCRKADIDSLASWGFNSVRLPMHYNLYTLPIEDEPVAGQNTWLNKGFEMTDTLISWCKQNNMYVILDLHGAPGGQGYDAAISDYDATKPSLWESAENRAKAVALWGMLADRYKDEPIVAGYDLLNEVNWDLPGGTALRNLYGQMTDAIRAVDQNHIIFIEGNWFANDFTGLTPPWDDNMVYSPHKYWSINDQGSIQWVLTMRDQYNVPLYLGESGENSNVWFRDAIKLLEDNNIGWAWWPMKKVEAIAGPLSVVKTSGYQTLLNYWENGGTTPSPTFAKAALMGMTENLKIENCVYQKDVIDAMFRQVQSDEPKPYTVFDVPGIVYPTDFDMGLPGIAYHDEVTGTYQVSTGSFSAWNQGWAYRNDGVDIERCTDPLGNGYNLGFLEDGDWQQYSVNVQSDAVYNLKVRVATEVGGGHFHFSANGADLHNAYYAPVTGGWQTWQEITVPNIVLDTSVDKIQFNVDGGGFNCSLFEFVEVGSSTDLPTDFVSGFTVDKNTVQISLNKSLDMSVLPTLADFDLYIEDDIVTVNEAILNPDNSRILTFESDVNFKSTDEIELSYIGTALVATDGTALELFHKEDIDNRLGELHQIPGKIEAEDYSVHQGVQLESCQDDGGGQNVGYLDTGDYMDYEVEVLMAGMYNVNYRTASEASGGGVQLRRMLDDGTNNILHFAEFENTGGWQDWETTSEQAYLTSGIYKLRVQINEGSFNLNWIEFDFISDVTEISSIEDVNVFPNPTTGDLYINANLIEAMDIELTLVNMLGQVVQTESLKNVSQLNHHIDMTGLAQGSYFVRIVDEYGGILTKSVVKME